MASKKLFSALICFCLSFPVLAQELQLNVEETIPRLLVQIDTDGDKKITIEDEPKMPFLVPLSAGDSVAIEEIYFLSNLLQELAIARAQEKDSLQISLDRIKEAPAKRISRRIKEQFWDDLTRSIDQKGLRKILKDSKAEDSVQRLYVPASDTVGIKYYRQLQQEFENLEVVILPKQISPQYVKSINDQPGLLALKIENGRGVPFVVP
ncbi:MAG: trehalase family glycosidase, partial [Salinimicrobium sediminis]|nr:trehalase family glycosidase [Salinimicrobium sediminis]